MHVVGVPLKIISTLQIFVIIVHFCTPAGLACSSHPTPAGSLSWVKILIKDKDFSFKLFTWTQKL
jgi:hypothetical protein